MAPFGGKVRKSINGNVADVYPEKAVNATSRGKKALGGYLIKLDYLGKLNRGE
jgi:hypothetical protein